MRIVESRDGYWCDFCDSSPEKLVQYNRYEDDEDRTEICVDCLKEALELLEND